MAWTMQTQLATYMGRDAGDPLKLAATVLNYEFDRLVKQRCPYCNGFGHSGNDCPTDRKVKQLRGGVKEQNEVLQYVRKRCRVAAGMGKVKNFSLLSARGTGKTLGKRKRREVTKIMESGNEFSVKNIAF